MISEFNLENVRDQYEVAELLKMVKILVGDLGALRKGNFKGDACSEWRGRRLGKQQDGKMARSIHQ